MTEITPPDETALFAPPVEEPPVAPPAVKWTEVDPDAEPDTGLVTIHIPPGT